jgi:hypothetical protein
MPDSDGLVIPFRPRQAESAAAQTVPMPLPKRPRGLPLAPGQPTAVQRAWLVRGLDQPGGKLPLFDADGKRVDARTVRACIDQGWAEPWFANPLKPDWHVCRLTAQGRILVLKD